MDLGLNLCISEIWQVDFRSFFFNNDNYGPFTENLVFYSIKIAHKVLCKIPTVSENTDVQLKQ